MSFPREATAMTALQRFGFGPKRDGLTTSGDALAALAAEMAARRVAAPNGPDLLSTTDAFQRLDEFRTARARARAAAALAEAARPEGEDAMAAPKPPPNEIFTLYRAEAEARLRAAADEPLGFGERLVWFWANHFAVSATKGPAVRIGAGPMEREAIRPHVFGRFADMLLAVESHPAMLIYLDNRQSIGPNSRAGVRRDKGLNENLAREILELHTLGPQGGYTQADVTAFAAVITGWTVIGPNDEDGNLGEFHFNRNRHEPGAQTVLGRRYAQEGFEQGRAVLDDLARHPATARHVAVKIARHFVADEPPPALVARLTDTFQRSDGDLASVYAALLAAPETWSAPMLRLRPPQEYVVAMLRASGIPFKINLAMGSVNALGQPLWQPPGPNGFTDGTATWATPEGLKARLDVAASIARQAGNAINPSELADALFGAALGPETRQAIARAETKQQGLALLLVSPELMRR